MSNPQDGEPPPHATTRSFREFLEKRRTEIAALDILSDRRSRKRLTAPLLRELEQALLAENPAFDEASLWQAYAITEPGKVKGHSAPGRFADLVPLVRFALEQAEILEPFADSTRARFDAWVAGRNTAFTRDELAWLERVRDHIGQSLSIRVEDLDLARFRKRGGLKKAQRLFGKWLPRRLDELNGVLGA